MIWLTWRQHRALAAASAATLLALAAFLAVTWLRMTRFLDASGLAAASPPGASASS